MRAILIQPEYGRRIGLARAGYGQFHPVTDRCVLGLTHSPDIALFNALLEQHVAFVVNDPRRAISRNFKGLVV